MKKAFRIRFKLGATAIVAGIVSLVLMLVGMTCFGNTIFTAGVDEPLQRVPTAFAVTEVVALVIMLASAAGYYLVDNSISERLRRK